MIVMFDDNNGKTYELLNPYIVVDGSNVAFEERDDNNKPKLSNILNLRIKLKKLGIIQYGIVCDDSLYYCIDERDKYTNYIKKKEIIVPSKNIKADIYILQLAFEKNGLIISKDKYKEFYPIFGKKWIENKRIPFEIVNGEIFFNKIIINKEVI